MSAASPEATPTTKRAGIGDEIWSGLGRINAALADAKIKARLAELGGIPLVGSPEDFGRLIAAEAEKWGKVVKFAGIKAE